MVGQSENVYALAPLQGACYPGTSIRWCRYAQPPATRCDASGIGEFREDGSEGGHCGGAEGEGGATESISGHPWTFTGKKGLNFVGEGALSILLLNQRVFRIFLKDFLTGERTFQSVSRRVESADVDANGLENPFSFTLRERMHFASALRLRAFASPRETFSGLGLNRSDPWRRGWTQTGRKTRSPLRSARRCLLRLPFRIAASRETLSRFGRSLNSLGSMIHLSSTEDG